MIASLRQRRRDDTGMTLVEVLVTTTILVVVLGMVMISMNLIDSVSDGVTAQYQEFDQVIPSLAAVRTLVAEEAEPAPVSAGIPTPAFSVVGAAPPTAPPYTGATVTPYSLNFAVSWYANVGTSYANVVGANPSCQPTCTAGPAKVVALEVDNSGNAATNCSTSTCALQVWMYLPLVGYPWSAAAGTSTCPVPVNGTSGGTCQYAPMNADGTPCLGSSSSCYYWPTNANGTPAAASNQFAGTYRLVANIRGVTNDPSLGSSDPLFSYTAFDTTTNTSYQLQASDLNQNPPVASNVPGSPSLLSCTGLTVETCPLDAIRSVGIHLQVDQKGSGTNGLVEDQVIDYRQPLTLVAQTADGCLPFQYNLSQPCDPYQS